MFDMIAKPFGWLLMVLYELVLNYGIAVILFALIVRLILTPFLMKSKRGTMQMSRLQPKMKELEKKHGANKQKYQAEVAKLYKDENVNPASGCIWGLLPFPIMIALYRAVIQPLTIMMGVAPEHLAEGGKIVTVLDKLGFIAGNASNLQLEQTQFISEHFESFAGITDKLRHIDFGFLGVNLGETPQWNFFWKTDWSDSKIWLPGLILFLLPVISGAAQFVSSKVMSKMNPMASPEGQGNTMQTMLLLMPLISVYIGFIMPAALAVYWTAGTVFYTLQDIWLTKRYTRIIDAEEAVKNAEREAREAEIEAKRIETERKKAENATERNRNTSKRKLQATEREEQKIRAAEFSKKDEPESGSEDEPSRVGHRRYARGRAYDPHRYDNAGEATPEYEPDDEPNDMSNDEPVDIQDGEHEERPVTEKNPEFDFSMPEVTVDDYVFDSGDEDNDTEE